MDTSNKGTTQKGKGGNPKWVPGVKCPNPTGRRGVRNKSLTGMEYLRAVMRGVMRKCYTKAQVIKMVNGLKTDKERLDFYLAWMAYELPKQTALTINPFANLSDTQLDDKLNEAKVQAALSAPLEIAPGITITMPLKAKENGTTEPE